MKDFETLCVRDSHRSWVGLREDFSEDMHRFLTKSPHVVVPHDWKHRVSAACTPQMLAVFLYRISHYLHARGWRRCAVLLSRCNQLLHKVAIVPESCIGPALLLPHPTGVTFCGIAGRELTLYSLAVCSSLRGPGSRAGLPRLGDRVTLGAHAVIMGPVSVGNDVKIAYSIRVIQDIPPRVMVVSNALYVRIRTARDRGNTAVGEVD